MGTREFEFSRRGRPDMSCDNCSQLEADNAMLLSEAGRLREALGSANLQNSDRHLELIRVTNMLNSAVPHGPAVPDDPCPAECKRCGLEKKYPEKRI